MNPWDIFGGMESNGITKEYGQIWFLDRIFKEYAKKFLGHVFLILEEIFGGVSHEIPRRIFN